MIYRLSKNVQFFHLFKSYEASYMIWNSWKRGSYLEMLDDLFAFEKKNEGIIFGEVGWFAGCRTTLVPAEKKWKRQTFNSSNCEICFPNIFHQKFSLKGTQESGNSYILQKAKVKASNVKVVRDNKIEVFWFPSFQVAIKFVACVFVFYSFFAILIYGLQISSLYKVVKQYRWAD